MRALRARETHTHDPMITEAKKQNPNTNTKYSRTRANNILGSDVRRRYSSKLGLFFRLCTVLHNRSTATIDRPRQRHYKHAPQGCGVDEIHRRQSKRDKMCEQAEQQTADSRS